MRRIPSAALASTFLLLGSAVSTAGQVPASGGPPTASEEALIRFTARVEQLRDELVSVRRDLHRHPEISGEEERTAGIVAERLRAAGFEVRTEIGGHGVIGVLNGTGSGPVLAFRADMDAVRSNAPDPVDFRSETPGVRHICGHDIHTTIGLALAEGFAAVRDQLAGSVMLIFQPAEESATGARAMLADGAFAGPKPDAVFAYHTTPFEVGQVAIASGTQMPGRDAVAVRVNGDGELEAVAQSVRELILATATLTGAEAVAPQTEPFVLVRGARASNDGAEGWTVRATLTTSGPEESREAREAIGAGLASLARAGLTLDLDYRERWVAGVTNDPALVETANATARAVLGDDSVLPLQSLVPAFSEDFGSFQEEVPGAMYFLGVSNSERGWVGMPHSPDYVADEESIFVGARTMAAVFFDLFERGVPNRDR